MKSMNKITLLSAIFALFAGLGLAASIGISAPKFEIQKSNKIEKIEKIKKTKQPAPTLSLIRTVYAEGVVTAPTGSIPVIVPKLPGTDPDDLDDPLATVDFLKALVDSIGGMKGAGVMVLVVIVVQLLMLFLRTPLAAFAGKWKMLIIYSLSMVGGLLALMAADVDWKAALLHSNTLAAVQTWLHQIWKQFVVKKDEKPTPA